jgi:hypothetical protein
MAGKDSDYCSDEWFRGIYSWASYLGLADEVGSSEYNRVLSAWYAAGRPQRVFTFMCDHANAGPGGSTPPDEALGE